MGFKRLRGYMRMVTSTMPGCALSMLRFRSVFRIIVDIVYWPVIDCRHQESITFEHEHEAKSYLELFRNR